MFSRIIVGYDRTERSADALALAYDLAAVLGAALVDPGPASPEDLYEFSPDDHADLVVIGSTPGAHPSTALPAAFGRQVVAAPRIPVALAPLGFAQSPPAPINQVGIAYDGSVGADAALAIGAEFASAAGARLELLAVAEPPVAVAGNGAANGNGGARFSQPSKRTRLELAASDALSQLPTEISAVGEAVYGIPTRTLLGRTAALDLMLVGSRGDGGPGRPLGSVCKQLVLGGAGCPLLVTPLATAKLERLPGIASESVRRTTELQS